MTRRSTLLPVMMVVVIVLLALIAIMTGRSNAPDVAVDNNFPHYVCTFNEYCEGPDCTRDAGAFVLYTFHENALPRIELDRFSARATLTETETAKVFETRGGEVDGTFTLFPDRAFRMTGFSEEDGQVVEHYAVGSCDALESP